ncbi:SDR family oxidoreductase [Rhizobium laguerreae]|uniref:SDR family NAD(P)-dependent oxidoreductase n=1 Tax=Rhizobium laguerreae TaxID=1076926 RepID=UPI00143FB284|nr:SDR family oxidoreductase [Rhizobium laguerreae]NKM15527.1 SDR family oxidoreductase [Rhizobium laguerreae]
MGKLDGKIALVTGGNSGIGLASAKRFIAEGAYVFITGRRQPELDKAVASLGDNVTGVRSGIGEFMPLGEITETHFDTTFGVNVKGTLFTVQKALPLMQGGGSIILTGSTTGSHGSPAFSVYGASKAAIRSFARNWILDLKGSGIRVNVLSPGATSTPGLHGLTPDLEQDRQMTEFLIAQTPLGRMGRPDEIAAAALFLASEESSFVNGVEFFVDGGMAQV